MSDVSKPTKKPVAVIQETRGNGLTVYWDREKDITTIFVPSWDENGRHYLREIVVAGNNVVSLGRDAA